VTDINRVVRLQFKPEHLHAFRHGIRHLAADVFVLKHALGTIALQYGEQIDLDDVAGVNDGEWSTHGRVNLLAVLGCVHNVDVENGKAAKPK
jgi:hypothetical protein